MALVFSTADVASFKVNEVGSTKSITLRGINADESDARVICNGVASLLAIGGIEGSYEDAARVVTENVLDDGN